MNVVVRIALSLVVIVFAIPGLIVEPGPVSEIVAIGLLGTIWGIDLDAEGGGSGS